MKKQYGFVVLAIMLAVVFAGCAAQRGGQVYYIPVGPPAQGTQQYTTDQPAIAAPSATPQQQYQEIVVDREIKVVYLDNPSKGDGVAGKMCFFEPNAWESQVVVYNDTAQNYVPPPDHPVWPWVQNIPTPNKLGNRRYESWYYKLFKKQEPVSHQVAMIAPTTSAQKETPVVTTMIIPAPTVPPAPAPKAAEQVAPPAQVSPAPATVYIIPPGYVKAETKKIKRQKPRRVAPPPQSIDEAAYLKKLEGLGYKGECAVFRFQRKAGMRPADGILGPATAREIDRVLTKKDP